MSTETVITMIASVIGGGFGAKMLEWALNRDTDKTRMRDELWKEIGKLREREGKFEERLDRQQLLIDRLNERQFAVRKLALMLQVRLFGVMGEVNELLREGGHPHRYDIERIKETMREGDEYAEGFQALEDSDKDMETPDKASDTHVRPNNAGRS